jgi:hypothetical protein
VVRPWSLDEPCGTHVLALRALDRYRLGGHGSRLRGFLNSIVLYEVGIDRAGAL